MGWIFSFLSFVLCGRRDFLYYAISRRLASNMNKIKKKKDDLDVLKGVRVFKCARQDY